MNNQALLWLLLTLTFIAIHAFYTMIEMAGVSFNKVRLQYYISKGNKRAIWLNHLLHRPTRLFGTTLLGVNIALQMGSECSRELYSALNINPNLAPITQVLLVTIFAEVSPMFAARRYAEHVAMLGAPILYFSSKIMTPAIWIIDIIARMVNFLIGSNSNKSVLHLSRDEIQKAIENPEHTLMSPDEPDDFNAIARNIFYLHDKTADQIMTPLKEVQMLPSACTIAHMRNILRQAYYPTLPVYHRSRQNVVGIAVPRKLISVPDHHYVREYITPPWFITRNADLHQILTEFRSSNRNIAIVLNRQGHAIGILTLQDIFDEIFGEMQLPKGSIPPAKLARHHLIIERTLPGNIRIADFNRQYGSDLPAYGQETLSQLIRHLLGHEPEKGETVNVGRFEFTVLETFLLGAQTIYVRSI
ncbi:MAG: hemolysin family protein [Chlamydiota bacterium]